MSDNFHVFTVGDRSYQLVTLQPFSATSHAFKLKKIFEKGLSNGLDSNVVSVLSNIDEATLKDVIFPILRDCALTCTTAEKKLIEPKDMDAIYTVDDMDEFFVVVWEVLKINFGPFFRKMAKNLFGFDLEKLDLDKIRAVIKNAVTKYQTENPKSPQGK